MTDSGSLYSLLGEVKILPNSNNEKSTHRTRRNPDLTFSYSIDLSWNDYQKKTESYSVTASGSFSGCGHDADDTHSINIPFQQDVTISRSASGYCRSHVTQYRIDGGAWVTFTSGQALNYNNNLELSLHARNDRKGFPSYSCKTCTVSATATFFGEVDTTSKQINLGNYVEKIPYTQDIQELQRVPISNITSQFDDGMVRDIQCASTSNNSNITISCEQVGEEFIVYAYSNIMPPVANFSILSAKSGVAPFIAKLYNTSEGNISQYIWTASNGQSQSRFTGEEFNWEFGAGTHEICLVVVNNSGLESEKVCDKITVANCEYSIIPSNFEDLASNSNDININVQTSNDQCAWKLTSNIDWLNISGDYVGNSTINYSVPDNKSTERRCGDLNIADQKINVCQKGNQIPIANFTYYPQGQLRAPIDVIFTNQSIDNDGNISDYSWTIEGYGEIDGVIYFEQAGEYTIFLTVTDDDGASSETISKIITIEPPLYTLTINNSDNGYVNVNDSRCGNPCIKEYIKGTQVKLNAIPSTGSTFTGWNGACSGNDTTCLVNINQSKSVAASFTRCNYQTNVIRSPYNDESHNNGVIHITAPKGCEWSAVSNDSWLTIIGNTKGNGSSSVKYSIKPNPNLSSRNGSVTIAGQTTFSIEQAGNRTPQASFTATPLSDTAPLIVNLDASKSGDPTRKNITYEWTSSDNQQISGVKPTITYTQFGSYTISLEVFDEYGAASTNVMSETIFVDRPSYSLSIGNNEGGTIIGEGINCGNDCKEGYFEGAIVNLVANPDENYVFESWNGTDCYDSNNCRIEITNDVNITANWKKIPPCTAQINTNDSNGISPLKVELNAIEGEDITSYEWSTSDGRTKSGSSVEFKFEQQGTHTITLKTICSSGKEDFTTENIAVLMEPIAQFIAFPNIIKLSEPKPIKLDAAESFDYDGEIFQYQWEVSDGQKSFGKETEFSFDTAGEYKIKLVVIDNDELSSVNIAQQTIIVVDDIENLPPTAILDAKPLEANKAPLTVNLDASRSIDPDGTIAQYQWFSSDGQSIDSEEQTSITFTENGSYTITLQITDNDGATDTVEEQVAVGDWHVLEFKGLKEHYELGEYISLELIEKLNVKSRFNLVDLWVAVEFPSGKMYFFTPYLTDLISDIPQPKKYSLAITDFNHEKLRYLINNNFYLALILGAIFINQW